MKRWLSKALNIQPGEWRRVILLCLVLAIPNAGIIWGSTVAYAAFLKQIGLQALPWVLVISSALSVLALSIYTAFVDRMANDRLLLAIFAIGAACIGLGLVLFPLGYSQAAYPFLYLVLLAWLAVANPHLTTYTNSFYDVQAAKRVYPVVLGAGLSGSVIAGLSMRYLNTLLRPEGIMLIWFISYLVAMFIVWLMPHLLKEVNIPGDAQRAASPPVEGAPLPQAKAQKTSYLENIREGLRYTLQSKYLLWIAASSLLLMALMAFLEYRSSQLLLESFGTSTSAATEFADYTGMLNGIANLIMLPMLLLGISRLIARMGLGNVALIFPVANLLITLGMVQFPGMYSASAAYLDRKALRTSFQTPVDSLLYNAVPLRIRGRARAFVSGLILPIGSLLGGLLLLLPAGKSVWFVSLMLALLAIAYLGCAFVIRNQYSQALVRMLQQEDYSFLLSQEASELPAADPLTLKRLQSKLEEATSHELKVFMTRMIAQLGGNQALAIIAPAIQSTAEGHTRSAMVDVLAASSLRGERLGEFYSALLNDPAPQVRQAAINGLERLASATDQQFLDRMLETIQDPDPQVCTRALSALAHSGHFYQLTPAVQILDGILHDPAPDRRAHGVSVLGKIDHPRSIQAILIYLDDADDAVRLEAALAIEEMASGGAASLRAAEVRHNIVDCMSQRLGVTDLKCLETGVRQASGDPVERIRLAAVHTLGSLSDHPQALQVLVASLTDPSPQVGAAASDWLVKCGKRMIPLVHPALQSQDPQMRKMAAVVLCRADARQFGPLIDANVDSNLESIYQRYAQVEALSTAHPAENTLRGLCILQDALAERNRQLADEILYLLAALHQPEDMQLIGDGLRSESSHVRANAAEALESLTSPHIARLVAPLFEPGVTHARLLAIQREAQEIQRLERTRRGDTIRRLDAPQQAPQALRQLATDGAEPWFQALAVFALSEIGVQLLQQASPAAPPEAQPPAEQPAPRRSPRRPVGNLLDALDAPAAGNHAAGDSQTPETPPGAPAGAPAGALHANPYAPGLQLAEVGSLIAEALLSPAEEVRQAARSASAKLRRASSAAISGAALTSTQDSIHAPEQAPTVLLEGSQAMLSIIDRIIFLKEVPFFQDMTVDQLKILGGLCEETLYDQDTRIFNRGDPGGVLYVVVNGKVGIEQEKRAGSFARLADIPAYSYFGETNFFDNSPHSTSAVAIQDTLALQLRREPLIALARQNPELSLKLINTLSQRLREANDRIAELTRSRPRELHKLYDQYE